jgi:hypothetical protein
MRLPTLTKSVELTKVVPHSASHGVNAQGCDILCLIRKAPQCIATCMSGDIVGCIACAGSAAAQCGCI